MTPAPIPIPTAGRWPADDVTNAQAPMALRFTSLSRLWTTWTVARARWHSDSEPAAATLENEL